MLYLVGLGLGDPKDITVRGLEIVKTADEVYLEAYTSILTVGKEALVSECQVYKYDNMSNKLLNKIWIFVQEKFYGREVILADREFVEQKAESFIESARNSNVAFLGNK